MNVWEQLKQLLASKVSEESFQNWLSKTRLDRVDGGNLVVAVPDTATKEWLQDEYGRLIHSAVVEMSMPFQQVTYEVASSNGPATREDAPVRAAPESPELDLNPRYSFDNFVVGACNQFAHAAARAVATTPARRYNPLFIYGGVGMGKTHLMHAIGRSLTQQYTGMRVVYTTSERFMNQLIHSIRTDKMALFHQQYRQADALLVDDIHILANKERTQEEFFHTFNDLYEHSKQIVLSSDSPPKDTAGLVDRLRSRFEWGLMVDIQPPDLETKMAILDRKAEIEGIHLPEDVRILIATKTKSNVRELEGALVKLIAYSSLTGININLSMAQQALRHLTTGLEQRVTIDAIIRQVAERFSLQPSQIRQKTNARKISYPRQIAMYLAKELTSSSLPEIGRAFGGKHHTTVLHSIQKIAKIRQRDPDLNRLLHSITDTLH